MSFCGPRRRPGIHINPARNGCQCSCHRTGAKHIVDCCGRRGRILEVEPICRMPPPMTNFEEIVRRMFPVERKWPEHMGYGLKFRST